MSNGKTCTCEERKMENWIVLHLKHNHSAFEYPKYGYHKSEYSVIKCLKCGTIWSTKSKYVEQLPLINGSGCDYM